MNAHQPAAGGWILPAALRDQLVALSTDAEFRSAPHLALAKTRAGIDAAFEEIEGLARDHGAAEVRTASARLVDSTVVGLLHMARVVVDDSAHSLAVPVACAAIGDYPALGPAAAGRGALLLLLPAGPVAQSRGRAMAEFMVDGLRELGVPIEALIKTLYDLEVEWRKFAPLVQRRRYIHGRYDLFVGLGALDERRMGIAGIGYA